MQPETDTRYADYFRLLRQSQAGLPPAEMEALLKARLADIRAGLASEKHPPEVIEAEMRLANSAFADTAGKPAAAGHAPAEKSPRPAAIARGFFARHTAAVLVALFAVAYVSVLAMFLREGHPKMVLTGVGEQAIAIEAHFISVDLAREAITMTLMPDIKSAANAERGRLTADITVEIDTGSSILTHTFNGGDAPAPWLAIVPIDEGDVLEYPFDIHTGDFHIKAARKGAGGSLARLDLDKVQHGFTLSARGAPAADGASLSVDFVVKRSPAVIFLAVIMTLSLTLVVTSAINVAWQVSMRGRKTEFSMMSWIAALLFVVPAVRGGLPGGPPPGALVDVALFFWLHVATVGALLAMVMAWTRQK